MAVPLHRAERARLESSRPRPHWYDPLAVLGWVMVGLLGLGGLLGLAFVLILRVIGVPL